MQYLILASLAILGITIGLTQNGKWRNIPVPGVKTMGDSLAQESPVFTQGSPSIYSQHYLCNEKSYLGLSKAIHQSLENQTSGASWSNHYSLVRINCKARLAFLFNDLKSICNETKYQARNKAPLPSFEYEKSRRRLSTSLRDLWSYYKNSTAERGIKKRHFEDARAYAARMMADIQLLAKNDGYEAWRLREANDLSSIVHDRLWRSQNPSNCSSSKVLA